MAKGDTAYTSIALGAHTDNTYFVRERVKNVALWLTGSLGPLDGSLRTPALPPPLSHGRIRRRDAPG